MTTGLPRDLASALAGRPDLSRTWPLTYVEQSTSTNDDALALAHAGAPIGTVVVADSQSAGRGRRGRAWSSPVGAGLYVSVLLQPFERAHHASGPTDDARQVTPSSWITIMAGLAAAGAVRGVSTVPACLKWPNDVVVHQPHAPIDRWHKLGGVLAEGVCQDGRVRAVVVGIGINIRRAAHSQDVAALSTSLEGEGAIVERGALFVKLLDELLHGCRLLAEHRDDNVRARFLAWSPLSQGGRLRWTTTNGEREGVAAGVDHDGALLVATQDGEERLIGGDLRWERHGTLE